MSFPGTVHSLALNLEQTHLFVGSDAGLESVELLTKFQGQFAYNLDPLSDITMVIG